MTNQPEQPKSTISCPACAYENGRWRAQCEACGAALHLPLPAVVSQRSRGASVRSWIIGGLVLVRLVTLLARCAPDSPPAYPPSYSISEDTSAFTSPLESPPLALDPLLWGETIFANETISVVHPLLWQVQMSDLATLDLEGPHEYMEISWQEDARAAQLLLAKQAAPEIFQAAAADVEQDLRRRLTLNGADLISFVQHDQAELAKLPLVFGVYEANLRADGATLTFVHFVTLCAEQRICLFQYGHEGGQPITSAEWAALARVAGTFTFADQPSVEDPLDLPTQPPSPLGEPPKGNDL